MNPIAPTPKGTICIVLHAHLPWIKHPECPQFLEESWLFEAVVECYLPLLLVLDGWRRDGIRAQITLSFSPPLASMLEDELLRRRLRQRLLACIELAEREVIRATFDPSLRALAESHRERLMTAQYHLESLDYLLLPAFAKHGYEGRIEWISTSATHALLPLLLEHRSSLHAQISIAIQEHEVRFGKPPTGFWLPECAWAPSLESELLKAGLRWTILESTSPALSASCPPVTVSPEGLVLFHRDPHSAKQVWSRESGYPGDPRYRDFYRDAGFDRERDYVRPALPEPSHAGFTGLKYHAIQTGPEGKILYDRTQALTAVLSQASHWLSTFSGRMPEGLSSGDITPLWICPYDAELFGHWWYEGPEFLDAFARLADPTSCTVELSTPSRWLNLDSKNSNPIPLPLSLSNAPRRLPGPTTWGEGGDLRRWIHPHNAWMRPVLQRIQSQTERCLAAHSASCHPLASRALDQAVRELLLAQSSDWPFLIQPGSEGGFPRTEFLRHANACEQLLDQIENGCIESTALAMLESANSLFPRHPAQSFLKPSSSTTLTPSR